MNNDAFEKWFDKEFPSLIHMGATYDATKAAFEAATKAALGSRVVLPERKQNVFDEKKVFYDSGFNDCLDSIKFIPLSTAEQTKTQNDLIEKASWYLKSALGYVKAHEHEARAKALIMDIEDWLRESIKKRLGGV